MQRNEQLVISNQWTSNTERPITWLEHRRRTGNTHDSPATRRTPAL